MKRLLALVLALLMVLASVFVLSACSDKKDDDKDDKKSETSEKNTEKQDVSDIHVFDDYSEVELGTPSKALDPEAIYDSIEYDPRMFYGNYRIKGSDNAEEHFGKDMPLIDYKQDYSEQITAFPYCFEAGKYNLSGHVMGSIRGKHLMYTYFLTEGGYLTNIFCTFEVENNKLVLNPVKEYEYDEETKTLKYVMSDTFLEYDFDFNGTELILSNEHGSVSLYSTLFYDGTYSVSVDNYASSEADKIDNFEYIYMFWDEEENNGTFQIGEDFGSAVSSAATLSDSGLMTFSAAIGDGVVTHQYAYFYCNKDGLILTDGNNTYYYCADYADREGINIYDNISVEDVSKVSDLSKEDIELIAETKVSLLDDLAKAYEDAGMNVAIDRESGEINLDATVLFDYNKYDISKKGKDFLKKFMKIYTETVFDEKYADFISIIMIEGHTDPKGNLEDNFELSENRAESVKKFCLSKECGVKQEYLDILEVALGTGGYADLDPVYTADGKIDDAASRRVSFRFVVDLSWLA